MAFLSNSSFVEERAVIRSFLWSKGFKITEAMTGNKGRGFMSSVVLFLHDKACLHPLTAV
jgi:hypothetical protein